MNRLPRHKAIQFSDLGLHLRRITPSAPGNAAITYAHRDDYYIFGLLESGRGSGIIDFRELHFSAGEAFLIHPGQVHRFLHSEEAEGWLLFAENSFVGNAEKYILDRFSLLASSFRPDGRRGDELAQIAAILAERINHAGDRPAPAVLRRLAEAFIAIFAEAAQSCSLPPMEHMGRKAEIVLALRRLLADHLTASRRPAYYAARLNISPVYLNEAVRDITGMSATAYIRSETVLQAKRMLAHTGLAVKEIAHRLGIDDQAYFSRLFTQEAGVSPTAFRRRNLE